MVARLDPIKDQATLIRAFAEIASGHPQAELWLIGDERGGELCDLAAGEGMADRAVFWGPRTTSPELLGQMDVFAFSTSRDEGFGIALIEAMAAGLPVVASDVPACREVLDDGAAGILVPAGDPAPLARALCDCWARRTNGRRGPAARSTGWPRATTRACCAGPGTTSCSTGSRPCVSPRAS